MIHLFYSFILTVCCFTAFMVGLDKGKAIGYKQAAKDILEDNRVMEEYYDFKEAQAD